MRGDEIRETQINIRETQIDIREARFGEGFAPTNPAARRGRFVPVAWRTRLSHEGMFLIGINSHARAASRLREIPKTSRTAAISGLRSGSIRENIIGRTLRAGVVRFGTREGVRGVAGALAFLQKQPGHGGAGLISQPLVHQSADLLAKIRGVGETRQLEALQGVFGCREKEVPRRFRGVIGHIHLRQYRTAHNKNSVITVNSTKHY